jgi:acetyl esterase/lipase
MRKLIAMGIWASAAICVAAPIQAQSDVSISPDVVYGHKDGLALTFDVLTPADQNGAAVLFIVSGGWISTWNQPTETRHRALTRRGFTVFRIRHGSAPRYTVPEAYADVRRAVRFIRHTADNYGIDADRLGVYGGSAGGHLALMLGLASDEGDPTASDVVLQVSSRVGAVVARFPPIDLRTHSAHSDVFAPSFPSAGLFFASGVVRSSERFEAIGGGPVYTGLDFDEALMASVSPILHVSADDPATLLIHGDADQAVDLNNSQVMHRALSQHGVETDLVIVRGGPHGFTEPEHERQSREAMVAWFERHLGGR